MTAIVVRMCDVHAYNISREHLLSSLAVRNAAVTITCTLAASITTGVVVGKAVATTNVTKASASTSAALSSKSVLRSPVTEPTLGSSTATAARKHEGSGQTRSDCFAATARDLQHASESTEAADTDESSSKKVAFEFFASLRDSVLVPSEAEPLHTDSDSVVIALGQDVASPDVSNESMGENHAANCWATAGSSMSVDEPVELASASDRDEKRPGFFCPGRVLITLRTTSTIEPATGDDYMTNTAYIDRNVDDKPRSTELRLLVIRNEGSYSLCAPIYLCKAEGKGKNNHRGPYEIPIRMAEGENGTIADCWGDTTFEVLTSDTVGRARIPKQSLLHLERFVWSTTARTCWI